MATVDHRLTPIGNTLYGILVLLFKSTEMTQQDRPTISTYEIHVISSGRKLIGLSAGEDHLRFLSSIQYWQ